MEKGKRGVSEAKRRCGRNRAGQWSMPITRRSPRQAQCSLPFRRIPGAAASKNLLHVTNRLYKEGMFVQIRWMHRNKTSNFQCCQCHTLIRVLPEGAYNPSFNSRMPECRVASRCKHGALVAQTHDFTMICIEIRRKSESIMITAGMNYFHRAKCADQERRRPSR